MSFLLDLFRGRFGKREKHQGLSIPAAPESWMEDFRERWNELLDVFKEINQEILNDRAEIQIDSWNETFGSNSGYTLMIGMRWPTEPTHGRDKEFKKITGFAQCGKLLGEHSYCNITVNGNVFIFEKEVNLASRVEIKNAALKALKEPQIVDIVNTPLIEAKIF